ncbi:MAG: hypothetical protein LUE99_08565 [Bacteroides sp.]|nr:hypothetical protein [Bacteroides sp.]
MKTTVRTFWIGVMLVLLCSAGNAAVDFTKVSGKYAAACEVSASLSSCSSASDTFEKSNSTFRDTQCSWNTDVELGYKPFSRIYSSSQQSFRRTVEEESLLRNIFQILSNHAEVLVHGRAQLYYSDKDPDYAVTGCDYYVYMLRQILI